VAKDTKLIERLDKMEAAGMARTKEWVSIFQNSMRYTFGDQLQDKKHHKDWEWIIINYIWPAMMQEISKLAKIDAEITCNPQESSDVDAADTWQGLLQFQWENSLAPHGMRLEQIRALLDGNLFGYWISKIHWDSKPRRSWDSKKKEWIGDVRHTLWHPAEFWASEAECIDEGPCGTVRYSTLDYALHRWPDFARQLKDEATKYRDENAGSGLNSIRGAINAGTITSTGTNTGGMDKGMGVQQISPLLDKILNSARMSVDANDETEFVKVSETYFFDDETTNEKEEQNIPAERLEQEGRILRDMNGNFIDTDSYAPMNAASWPTETVRQWKEPKYPKGRYVIRACETILNEDNQVWQFSRWPFIVVPHYLLPHMWQGVDGVQMYKSAQDMINVTVSHLVNNLKQFGDPKIILEDGAISAPPGRTKKHFRIAAGAGAIIRVVKGAISGNRIKIIDPPQPSSGATQLYHLFSQEYKNLQGLQSTARGEKEPGEMSATQSQHLTMSSFDRVYLQSIYQKNWVCQVAQLTAEMDQLYYDEGRIVRILGEDRKQGIIEITQKLKDFKFDVSVEAGTALPFDDEKRMMQYAKAYELMANPVANPMLPEMLRILNIPNYRKLLGKYAAWQQYMEFLQLYESVTKGEVTPEQAVQMLVERAKQEFGQAEQTMGGVAAKNIEKEKLDKEREKILDEGRQIGRIFEQDRQKVRDQVRKEEESKKKEKNDKYLFDMDS